MSSPPPQRSGISLSTLFAAAIASVVAAVATSHLWKAGTLMATAMTPVIVTLVKEAIERPAQRVSSMASRSARPAVARTARVVAPPPPEADAPPPPVSDPDLSQVRVYGRERAAGRHWKLALLTGVLAFLLAAAILTVPELVAGRSVVSGGKDTTLFGGRRHGSSQTKDQTETTTGGKTTTTHTTTTETTTTTTPSQTTTSTPSQTTPTTPTQTSTTPTTTTPAPQAAPGATQTTPTTP
jgi:hypothetical protein